MRDFRINFIFGSFLFLCLIFILRVFNLQVINSGKYKVLAQQQHWASIKLPAKRGEIYTSDGFPLALTETKYLLYAEPHKIKNPNEYAAKLSSLLDADMSSIKRALSTKSFWIPLKENLNAQKKIEIENLNLKGLGFEEEFVRYYPENTLAAHILGFVGSNKDGLPRGYYGLEGFYDGDLKGVSGFVFQEKDAYGAPIVVGGYKKVPPEEGRDLVLTLDRVIQFMVEQKLKESVKRYNAKSGSIVVVVPQTGAVLALANYPTFNPTNPTGTDEGVDLVRNKVISEVYEPGSVVKALTMSAALDLGLVKPQTTYLDDGPKVFSGNIVDNWDKRHYGVETMVSVLQHSNNLGAAWVGHQIGAKGLYKYFIKFGLGTKSGIDLEGEEGGIIRDPSTWRDIDLATASFGQGISVTPLQLVMAFATIANGGIRMKPHIVSEIVDASGKVMSSFKPKVVSKVISKETAETMVKMLTSAVSGGEAKFFASKKYLVAGKTGTAQVAEKGKYDPNKTNATFIGFLPNSRNFVMLVRFEEPTASIYAAETAVPVWMDLAENIAAYLRIPPDK